MRLLQCCVPNGQFVCANIRIPVSHEETCIYSAGGNSFLLFRGIIWFSRGGCVTCYSKGNGIRVEMGDLQVFESSLEIGDYLWSTTFSISPRTRMCTYLLDRFSASASTKSVVPFSSPGFSHSTKFFSPSHVASVQFLSATRTFVFPVLKSRTLISAVLLCVSKDHDCTVKSPRVPAALGLMEDLRGAEIRALGVNFAQTVIVNASSKSAGWGIRDPWGNRRPIATTATALKR